MGEEGRLHTKLAGLCNCLGIGFGFVDGGMDGRFIEGRFRRYLRTVLYL